MWQQESDGKSGGRSNEANIECNCGEHGCEAIRVALMAVAIAAAMAETVILALEVKWQWYSKRSKWNDHDNASVPSIHQISIRRLGSYSNRLPRCRDSKTPEDLSSHPE